MSDLEIGYCPLNGHGLYGGSDRPCPWCHIVALKKAMAESCDDMRFEYAGCERAEIAEAKYQNDLNAAIAIVIAISEPTGHADTFESLTAEWVDRMIEAETKLLAMKYIEQNWGKCDYDEQECLRLILEVLHMEPNNEATKD